MTPLLDEVTWVGLLDLEHPDLSTLVGACEALLPCYALSNPYRLRDAIAGSLWTYMVAPGMDFFPSSNVERRSRRLSQLANSYIVTGPALVELKVLDAIARLGVNQLPVDEAWRANGAHARFPLDDALTIDPGHVLAGLLRLQGDLLAPVSGGSA